MRSLIAHLALAGAAIGQTVAAPSSPADLQQVMEHFASATNALERAVAAGDRGAFTAPLAELEQALEVLPAHAVAAPAAEVERAQTELRLAMRDLRQPVADGSASDGWDLARLRRACTECHLRWREDNVDRGMFPNHGNLVTGTVRLVERDGSAHDDAADIVVFLEPVATPDEGALAAPMPRPPSISQRGRRFDPAVLVVTRGTTVHFPNDDVVFHNVFSRSRSNWFDLGTYGQGKQEQHTFTQTGLVKVHCNIHPDMASHVLVLDTAHHAVTTDDGFWAIPDVPDGAYTLRVWHALADEQRQRIQVENGQLLTVPLQVQETRQRVQHTDKHGRPYKKKY